MWTKTETQTEAEKRIAPKVVKLLADEGVKVEEASGILEHALGIIMAPMHATITDTRARESTKLIKE